MLAWQLIQPHNIHIHTRKHTCTHTLTHALHAHTRIHAHTCLPELKPLATAASSTQLAFSFASLSRKSRRSLRVAGGGEAYSAQFIGDWYVSGWVTTFCLHACVFPVHACICVRNNLKYCNPYHGYWLWSNVRAKKASPWINFFLIPQASTRLLARKFRGLCLTSPSPSLYIVTAR